MVLTKRRQEIRFLEMRAMFEAILRPHTEKDTFSAAFQDYANAMFPFLGKDKVDREKAAKVTLQKWLQMKALRVKPIEGFMNKAAKLRMRRAANKLAADMEKENER